MKFKILSQQARIETQLQRKEKALDVLYNYGGWIDSFAYLPKRIDENTVVWWQDYQYRLASTERVSFRQKGVLGQPMNTIHRVLPVFEYREVPARKETADVNPVSS